MHSNIAPSIACDRLRVDASLCRSTPTVEAEWASSCAELTAGSMAITSGFGMCGLASAARAEPQVQFDGAIGDRSVELAVAFG